MRVLLTRRSFLLSTSCALGGPLAVTSAHSLEMSRQWATGLAFSLGKVSFSTITLGGIGLIISIFSVLCRVSVAGLTLGSLASKSLRTVTLAHVNSTLFCASNAQKRTGSQQGKKTIFLHV